MMPDLKRADKLALASKGMLDMGNKFFRMIQVLPCIPSEYTELAEQFLFLPVCLENLHTTLKATVDEEGKESKYETLFEDIDKLCELLDAFYDQVEGALPDRFDGEVEYNLPFQVRSLIVQIQATESASNMLLAVLKLGGLEEDIKPDDDRIPSVLSRYRVLAETTISSVKGAIRRLACNMPMGPRSDKHSPSPMYKRHEELKEFLEQLLRCWEVKPETDEEEDKQTKEKDSDSKQAEGAEREPGVITKDDLNRDGIQTIGKDARADGMPPGIPYDPNAVYVRINKKHLDERTLKYFDLPWSVVKDDPDFYVIWQSLDMRETDELFEHTRRIRMLDEQGTIEPGKVVDALLKRWLDVEPLAEEDRNSERKKDLDEDLEQFEKDLEDLKIHANKPMRIRRRPIRADSPPPPLGRSRPFKGTTEYWKPWTEHSWSLYSSLKRNGWKPIYSRGNDSGQTWFHGERVIHVRRFKEDYTPQDLPAKSESLAKGQKEYLLIGKEWVEEEAIIRSGFDYRSLKDNWALDPRLAWFDIDILTAATSAFREERMFRKYRNLPGGDLHGQICVPFPSEDYLQGPELYPFASNNFAMPRMQQSPPVPVVPVDTTPQAHYHPTRLSDIIEEAAVHEAPAQVVRSPTIESHDSFIEVEN